MQGGVPIPIEHIGPDHHIDSPGLIFKCHKENALGGARPLTMRDQSTGSGEPAVGVVTQGGH